jgi:two-component system KDP operon response regulator KdpE
VLTVDDEAPFLHFLQRTLTAQGFIVLTAGSAREALRLVAERRPEIVVLDVTLPDANGIELMRALRNRSSIPVILMSGRDSRDEKILGLDAGADDYVVKPFSPEELAARVRAVLRRTRRRRDLPRQLRLGEVEVDLERRVVSRREIPVRLTRTEWMLLEHLIAHSGEVLTNRELLNKVWGSEYTDDVQYLRVWISRLRRKLEPDPGRPRIIRTYAGIGYMFDPGGGSAPRDRRLAGQ